MQPVIRFAGYAAIMVVIMLVTSGCVTMAKNMLAAPAQPLPAATQPPHPTIHPTPAPVYIEPENLMMFRTGGRWLGQGYKWQRDNVSGQKDMVVNVTVYDWKFMRGYSWWSVSWGRYYWQTPPIGTKYLFVFIYMEMEGDDQTYDPRMWGMGQDHFYVQYRGNVSINGTDPDHLMGVRIKELEETFTRNDDVRVFDYGYYRGYGSENGSLVSERAFETGYLRMGRSNAWDGYIIYTVPANAQPEELLILGRFDGFGSAWWRLAKQPAVAGG